MRFASLLLLTALMTLLSNVASADVFLAWNDCLADGGAMDRTSACASDGGVNRLVASYVSPSAIANFVSIDGTIDLASEASAIPAWWDFKNAGACRQTAASINIDVNNLPNFGASCADTWDGGASATGLFTGYLIGFGGDGNRARAVFAIARGASNPFSLQAGTNYFAWIWQITNAATSSCAGCATPVAIVLNSIILSPTTGQAVTVSSDEAGSQPCATWQSATNSTCQSVPVAPRTWGSVKSLYR